MSITARIDSVTQIPPGWLAPELPAPPSMKIELSNRCPYRCSFCALRTREQPSNQDMDIDLFAHIAREAREAGVEEIGLFFLGESFSAPHVLTEACRIAKQELEYPYVFLTTNGALAQPHYVRILMEAGLDSLKFSVNAADYEQFEQVMGVKASYMDRALDNLRDARRIRDSGSYATRIYASSIAFDGEQGERMQELLESRVLPWVDEHYRLPLYSMSLNSQKIIDDTGYVPTHGNSGRIEEETGRPNRPSLPCWSAFREAHVRVDGHMSACCFGADDRFDIGKMPEMSFMECWNSPQIQVLREAQLRTRTEGPKALEGTACAVCTAYA